MIRLALMLIPACLAMPALADPRGAVGSATAAARVEPAAATFAGAIQRYAWADGALFQVYTAPGQVTDIALEAGEELVGPGPVAAGDTARWLIGDTISGIGTTRRVHILVKPTRPDIATNLVIHTDRRTYHLELRATRATYMAGVSWTYPADALVALRKGATAAEPAPAASAVEVAGLDFGYRIRGNKVPWRPLRAFDDGRRLYVEFAPGIAQGDLPPLFALAEDGTSQLVNYRVTGRFIVVDGIPGRTELRLTSGRKERAVRIERDDRS